MVMSGKRLVIGLLIITVIARRKLFLSYFFGFGELFIVQLVLKFVFRIFHTIPHKKCLAIKKQLAQLNALTVFNIRN